MTSLIVQSMEYHWDKKMENVFGSSYGTSDEHKIKHYKGTGLCCSVGASEGSKQNKINDSIN